MKNQEKQVCAKLERVDHKITKVTITPDSIQLGDQEWVRWTFEGLEGNEFGFISFAEQYPRLGPFASIRTYSSDSVLAKGNKGVPGSFTYTALILDIDNPKALASKEGTVENTTSTKNTAPDITVTYHGDQNPPYLEVDPYHVGLNTGDTATWHFRKLPPNAFACFRFPDKKLGPFIAFNADRGDDSCTVEASGTGFVMPNPVGTQLTYHIELRDWAGNLLGSDDPIIDNLGPPLG
jgi:hypothetical protein